MTTAPAGGQTIATGVDDEIFARNQRRPSGHLARVLAALCVLYTAFHIAVLNLYPLEPWTYRLIHVGGGLGIGFLLFSALSFEGTPAAPSPWRAALIVPAAALVALGLGQTILLWIAGGIGQGAPAVAHRWTFGVPLALGAGLAMAAGWLMPDRRRGRVDAGDLVLAAAAVAVTLFIILHAPLLRLRAGTGLAKEADMWAALVRVALVLELTRRLAGLALVIIAGIFVIYRAPRKIALTAPLG